jgi:hypothetical protein
MNDGSEIRDVRREDHSMTNFDAGTRRLKAWDLAKTREQRLLVRATYDSSLAERKALQIPYLQGLSDAEFEVFLVKLFEQWIADTKLERDRGDEGQLPALDDEQGWQRVHRRDAAYLERRAREFLERPSQLEEIVGWDRPSLHRDGEMA